jgi:hypothetical protein
VPRRDRRERRPAAWGDVLEAGGGAAGRFLAEILAAHADHFHLDMGGFGLCRQL